MGCVALSSHVGKACPPVSVSPKSRCTVYFRSTLGRTYCLRESWIQSQAELSLQMIFLFVLSSLPWVTRPPSLRAPRKALGQPMMAAAYPPTSPPPPLPTHTGPQRCSVQHSPSAASVSLHLLLRGHHSPSEVSRRDLKHLARCMSAPPTSGKGKDLLSWKQGHKPRVTGDS